MNWGTFKIFLLWIFILSTPLVLAQTEVQPESTKAIQDTTISPEEILKRAQIKAEQHSLEIVIRNVDVRRFPEIAVIVEAFDQTGKPVDTLSANDLRIYENGVEKLITRVQRIQIDQKVPIDFVFVLDITGTMGAYINGIRSNVSRFLEILQRRGIDYRLALILFTDVVEKTFPFTHNVAEFLAYLQGLKAEGGLDEKENALEALATAAHLPFRSDAQKVVILITDAPYHQKGEFGSGTTLFTTKSITELLQRKKIRVFCITQPKLKEYWVIASNTRGMVFDIDQPFFDILNRFSQQLTTLFSVHYRSDREIPPDSLEVAIFDRRTQKLVKKKVSIIEIGRKFIIESLLFETGSAELPDTVAELDRIAKFMQRHSNIKIRVEGHTDAIGSDQYNQRLSLQRALAVKRYLVARGIDPKRILVYGYGEGQPIASNETEFGRRLNRRTEIVIVEK